MGDYKTLNGAIICKYCKKPMKELGNQKRFPFDDDDKWVYECHNEDCEKQPSLTVTVCHACERESFYWSD